MSRIEDAIERLESALDRLSAAVDSRLRTAALAQKRVGELEGELARLKLDHAALEATVDTVAARLDRAINRLKADALG